MPRPIWITGMWLNNKQVKNLDKDVRKHLDKLLYDVEWFKRNWERSKIFMESLENGLRKACTNKDLIEWAE